MRSPDPLATMESTSKGSEGRGGPTYKGAERRGGAASKGTETRRKGMEREGKEFSH